MSAFDFDLKKSFVGEPLAGLNKSSPPGEKTVSPRLYEQSLRSEF
jgi:hypothetical protein